MYIHERLLKTSAMDIFQSKIISKDRKISTVSMDVWGIPGLRSESCASTPPIRGTEHP